MRLHYLQHVSFEGPGFVAQWAAQREIAVAGTLFCERQPLPALDRFDMLVVLGGPMGVGDERRYAWLREEKRFLRQALHGGKAVLGICLGAQLVAEALGGAVSRNRHREIGWFPLQRAAGAGEGIGAVLPKRFDAFHWHGDTFDLPPGSVRLAQTPVCRNQAFQAGDRVAGLQFHLESTVESVEALLDNCGHEMAPGPWVQSPHRIREQSHRIPAGQRLMARILDQLAGTVSG